MKDFIRQKRKGETKLILTEFLNRKPLYYKEIDYDRMPNCWERVKNSFKTPKQIIHIIGTNGKGSTGRFLAYYLYKMGFKVGHYSSPHILKFNERVWKNGSDVDDLSLEKAHNFLLNTLPKRCLEELSYFEYTTLLGMRVLGDVDYLILEAGLGGERDATSVFERDITLVTPIDFDHQSFLGDSIEEIAKTKLKSIKKRAIIGKQLHDEVYQMVERYPFYIDYFNNYEIQEIREFIKKNRFAGYLSDNLALALSYVKEEGLEFNLDYLKGVKLKGRMEKIGENIYIDVGHNSLAAKVVADYFKDKKVNLIYNTYKDKNYRKILEILKPIIKKLSIIEVENDRIADKKDIIKVAEELGIEVSEYRGVEKDALNLIFGSFSVVEKFLKDEK
jgi:dihydrofolate synthase/folylpolyglutamate synthase